MANANDIINYIGIPLAVLGVMPLLWNMVKSLIIRYRLLSSLPKEVRGNYSLIMDPAAGSVSVSVDTPKLHFECLWRSFTNSGQFISGQNDLLGESWMGLKDSGIHPWYYGPRKRFVVESDLRVQSVGVECDWKAFVRLGLAMGVDPYSGGILDLKCNKSASFNEVSLKHSGGFSVMKVCRRESRVIARIIPRFATVSIKTGLAWERGIVVVQDHVMSLGESMEEALVWVLYAETLCHASSRHPPQPSIPNNDYFQEVNVLPVTQQILKVREDAVEELRLMTHLETLLNEIFLTKGPLVSSILETLRREWDTPDVIFENKRNARPYTENPPGYLDIWNKIHGNDTFIALQDNYNPVPTLRTRSNANLTELTTPMAVLARVIIAVSSIQKWPRQEWSVQTDENGKRSFLLPEDPMDELLSESEGYDPANPYGSEERFVYLE